MAVITSGVVSFFVLTPIYEASTTVLVGKPADGAQIIYQDMLSGYAIKPPVGKNLR